MRALVVITLLGGIATACGSPMLEHRRPAIDHTLRRIAVGSCLRQSLPAPALRAIAESRPDVMLLIGDNVYADTDDSRAMRDAYATLERHPDYRALVATVPVLAVWDDHDYGRDDAGADWPFKRDAKEIFLDFFDEPDGSPRRRRPALYDAWVFGPPGRRVQIVMLDTRWFRSPLVASGRRQYAANDHPAATILGDDQWAWLAAQLRVPAEVRLLVSSIQVVADEHPFEKWANVPRERERLLRTIGASGAAGVVVLSGDRHRGELSVLEDSALSYRLWDLTASSLNVPTSTGDPNRHRVGEQVMGANYATVDVEWEAPQPAIVLRLHDDAGGVRVEQRVPLTALAR